MTFNRRAFILGATAALAAPAVVRAESLMQIAVLRENAPRLIQLTTGQLIKARELAASAFQPMLLEKVASFKAVGYYKAIIRELLPTVEGLFEVGSTR